jgi:hypothetical protein
VAESEYPGELSRAEDKTRISGALLGKLGPTQMFDDPAVEWDQWRER